MFGWSAKPAKAPTDTVVPFRFFDDTPLWRAFILYSMFVFDGVLDPIKLRESLEALAQRNGWRRLGARMRLNGSGGLEYHFPSKFTSERRPLTFSHAVHNMAAADHPVASRIPKPSARPATVGDPDELRPLFYPEGAPLKLDDYMNKDLPQLGLHIVSFSDKTLVTLYWPHTLMDALGKRALLDAWVRMLQGRADEIPAPLGGDGDPLAELGTRATEMHKLESKRLSMFGLVQYGISNILDFCRTQENRMVCVPAAFISKLRTEALVDLGADADAPSFLSEGDVLCAWWTRIATAHLPRKSNRTVVLNNAYSLRAPLAGDLLAGGGRPYVSNAIAFVNVLTSLRDINEKPLGHLAAAIRRAIQELGTRDQVEAFAALWRGSQGKLPPFFGDSGMHMITYSNWAKARLFETDFSAALATPGKVFGRAGKPSYIQNNQFGFVLPNGFPIIGKDGDGNYWLSGYMNKGQWSKIDELLAQA